jgi:phosphopantothenoylcysteine decarboxylase/phosphopantothenate--cysteine ligase
MPQITLDDLKGTHTLVGISGGISAFKTVQLVSSLVNSGADVEVILTPNAFQFVGPASFQGLTGRKVRSDIFDCPQGERASHVELGLWADLYVIAPATATCLAKMAAGLADNLLVATYLAVDCPVLVAPAMNSRMWAHVAVQAQAVRLREFGVEFVGPESGRMACGEPGEGRMSEPEDIYRAVVKHLAGNRQRS